MTGLTPSLAEAFADAAGELDLAESSAPETALPAELAEPTPVAEQAPAAESDEPPDTGNDVDSLLGELGEETPEVPDPSSPDFWGMQVELEIDGSTQNVSLDEMRRGFMRQADYTRKTQEVARERALVREAAEFHQAFKEDPQGFAQYLAAKAGYISEDGVEPKDIKLFTEADIQAKVDEQVQAALAEHPDVIAARNATGAAAVEAAFAELEQEYGAISRENRIKVLTEAQRRGTTDIRLTLESMLLRASRIAEGRETVKKTAAARPGVTPTEEPAATPQVLSLNDAFRLAEQELSGSVA